jgi:hypothetical protein
MRHGRSGGSRAGANDASRLPLIPGPLRTDGSVSESGRRSPAGSERGELRHTRGFWRASAAELGLVPTGRQDQENAESDPATYYPSGPTVRSSK